MGGELHGPVARLSECLGETGAQAAGFAVVGVTNTAVSYVVYAATLAGLRAIGWIPGSDYLVAQAVSFVLGVLWSYWWNSRLVFGVRGWRALLRTYASYSVTGLFLSSALLVLWVRVLAVPEYAAPLLSLVITVPANFVLNKWWAFGGGREESTMDDERKKPC